MQGHAHPSFWSRGTRERITRNLDIGRHPDCLCCNPRLLTMHPETAAFRRRGLQRRHVWRTSVRSRGMSPAMFFRRMAVHKFNDTLRNHLRRHLEEAMTDAGND